MINDIKQTLIQEAQLLGDYQSISNQKLWDNYCDAIDNKDKAKQNQYVAAIILRYWYKIQKTVRQMNNFRFKDDDAFDLVYESISHVVSYRMRRNENSDYYQHKDGGDIAFFTVLKQKATRWLKENYAFKRKANQWCYSTDDEERPIMIYTQDKYQKEKYSKELIQHYLDCYDVWKALVVDTICFKDSFVGENYKFSKKKVIKCLFNIDPAEAFIYLDKNYTLFDKNYVANSLKEISKLKRQKVVEKVNDALIEIKKFLIS